MEGLQAPSLLRCFGGIGISAGGQQQQQQQQQDSCWREGMEESRSGLLQGFIDGGGRRSSTFAWATAANGMGTENYEAINGKMRGGGGGGGGYGRLQTLHEEEEGEEEEEEAGRGDDERGSSEEEEGMEYKEDEEEEEDEGRQLWRRRRRRVEPGEQKEVQEAMAAAAALAAPPPFAGGAAGSGGGKLGVVRSKLKSSTRSVAATVRRLLHVAQRSGPHVAELFVHNHLLVQQLTGPSCLSPFS